MFVGLFVPSRVFLRCNLLKISLLEDGKFSFSSSLLSSFIEKSSVVCSSKYNAAILFAIGLLAAKYFDTLLLNSANSTELGITELLIVRTTGISLQGRTEAARAARLITV